MSSKPATTVEQESALIARVRNGDRDAFYDLIRPYEKAIYFAAHAVLQNEHDAEDCAQEAVLKAFKNLDSFRAEARFSTWLIQITINEARMRLRKEHRNLYESLDEPQETGDGDYVPKDFADWREIPSECLQRKELKDALSRALAELKPMYREVLLLRDVQHMSIAETALALGISESSVKTRLLRARLQMRDALSPGLDGAWSLGETAWRKTRPW